MFIISKRNYNVRRADGSLFLIKKDYIGEIPEDVAASQLVQRAIRGGMIAIPQGKADAQLEQADAAAGEREERNDIRPDAGDHAAGQGGQDGGGTDGPDGPADTDGQDAATGPADAKGKGTGEKGKKKRSKE